MWRSLECLPDAAEPQPVAGMSVGLIRELQELIEALDRRAPQLQRGGEASIAQDAAALRMKAVTRLAELKLDQSSRTP